MIGAPARQRDKIVTVGDLPKIRARYRDSKIVHCHGAFDLIHLGHLTHFEEARALGDLLVVTLTGDAHITKKRSVTFSEDQRARQVAALEIVDFAAIIQEPTALSAIEALRPDFYVKGPEYADLTLDKSRSIYHEMRVLESYGGRMHFTSGETFSSTKLSHFLLNSPEAAQANPLLRNDRVLFKDISSRGYTLLDLKQFLAAASALRVCVIGEAIVDEWVDVTLTNLSTQSRCVAGLETARVRQLGGSGIVALHLANFVKHVDCFSNALSGPLPENMRVTPIASGELVETRFVDRETGRPVFKTKKLTVSDVRSEELPDFDAYDLVLIADFGHGLLDSVAVNSRISKRARAVVAAMVQVNSSNFGYNLPIKYRGASYYSLNRTEAELCLHERDLPLSELVSRSAALLHANAVSVTDGANGAMIQIGPDACKLPSLSVSTVDTIGCGDAYFALSSAALAANLPAPVVALAGSIGAAAMTQRRCNESPITEPEFMTIGKIVI
ncbi:MAG TPA: PfkB family carbohydrate kinase [Vicinamibacterales bacterium]|nr:PfkB family carbohydrate kinase [Vicinamibacterales bacterium]